MCHNTSKKHQKSNQMHLSSFLAPQQTTDLLWNLCQKDAVWYLNCLSSLLNLNILLFLLYNRQNSSGISCSFLDKDTALNVFLRQSEMICEAVSSLFLNVLKLWFWVKTLIVVLFIDPKNGLFCVRVCTKNSSKCFTTVEYNVECVKKHLFGLADITEHLINSDGVKERWLISFIFME